MIDSSQLVTMVLWYFNRSNLFTTSIEIKRFLCASKFCTVSELLRLELRGIQSKFLLLGSETKRVGFDPLPRKVQVTMKTPQRMGASGWLAGT